MSETLEAVAKKDAAETKKLAEQLLAQAKEQGIDLAGPGGFLNQLTKTVLETALEAEMTEHVGYAKHDRAGRGTGNSRNGTRSKSVVTEIGPVEIEVHATRARRSSRRSPANANAGCPGEVSSCCRCQRKGTVGAVCSGVGRQDWAHGHGGAAGGPHYRTQTGQRGRVRQLRKARGSRPGRRLQVREARCGLPALPAAGAR